MDEKVELLHIIEEDMKEQSELVIEQINYEIKAMEQRQLHFFEDGLKKEVESYKERELNDLNRLAATKSSQNKLEIKRDLLQLRQKLVEDLFKEVESKLVAFVESEDYCSYLKKKIEEIQSEGGIFQVRKKDITLMSELVAEKQLKCQVEEGEINLGGFRYIQQKERIEIDSTLDTSYEEQKVWFRSHSHLMV